jgi:hypothetical protein
MRQSNRSPRPSRSASLIPTVVLFLACPGAESAVLGPELGLSTEFVGPTFVRVMVEHTPDVAVSGNLGIAAWPLGDSRIAWSYSADGGSSWTQGGVLPRSAQIRNLEFPTVGIDDSGTAHIAVVSTDNFSRQSIDLYRLTADNGQFQVTGPESPLPRLSQNQGGYQFPRITCDPSSGRLYLAWTLHDHGSSPSRASIFLMTSLGSTWSAPTLLAEGACNGASLAVGPDGELFVAWNDFAANALTGRRSRDEALTFEPPVRISATSDNFTLPLSRSQGSRPNPLYRCSISDLAPNHPFIAFDRSPGPARGRLYVVWAERASGTVSTVTRFLHEVEPNGSLETAMPLPLDSRITGTATYVHFEGGERDLFYFENAAGVITWFEGHSSRFCGVIPIEEPFGTNLLTRWVPQSVDPLAPPVIFTVPSNRRYYLDMLSANTPAGYNIRLRRLVPDPASVARDHRDVVMTWSSDGGQSWEPKRLVNDDPYGFDNYLPRVAVDGMGGVHVVWYDHRDDPHSAADANLYWCFSGDGGVTFAPSQRISQTTSRFSGSSRGTTSGDYLGLSPTHTGAIALWTQVQENRAETGQMDQDIHGRHIHVDRPIQLNVDKLRATAASKWVRLDWRVENVDQFWRANVYRRSSTGGVFEKLGSVGASGEGGGRFEFIDDAVEGHRRLDYQVQFVQRDGAYFWSDPIEVDVPGGERTRLAVRRVEPEGPGQLILMETPNRGELQVRLFDVRGAEVRLLFQGVVEGGLHAIHWDGLNAAGGKAPRGAYFVRSTLGEHHVTARLLHLGP